MNAFEAYQIYISLKIHFSSRTYDFYKFNGKTRTSVTSFEKRGDKAFFYKLANKYSKSKLIDLFVANLVKDHNMWVGEFLDETSEEVYTEWQKKLESLSYFFSEECRGLLEWLEFRGLQFYDLFKVVGADHPIIVKMVAQQIISIETFIIFDTIFDFCKVLDRRLMICFGKIFH